MSDRSGEGSNGNGEDEQAALRADAIAFMDRYLGTALDDASSNGENPAVVLYALLECAMRVAQAHFPEHAGQLYASATQMVFEAHGGAEGRTGGAN